MKKLLFALLICASSSSFAQMEVNKLKEQLIKKIESARYLSCGRKGAWGRRTMADEKRDMAIDKLKRHINSLEYKMNNNH